MLPLSRWTRFRTSLCTGCWANCCSGWPVEVTVSDLISLGLLTEAQAQTDLKKSLQPLFKKRILKKKPGEPFVFLLGQRANGDCIYLNSERQCGVYDRRPEICRAFPKQGARPGYCPHRPRVAQPKARSTERGPKNCEGTRPGSAKSDRAGFSKHQK